MNNKLIIAGAGSGKTTFLIREAMKYRGERVLITTYTEANLEEIKSKFIKEFKCIPSHITIQTWFSVLIQHGVKPYQGSFNDLLFAVDIKGMILNNENLGKFPLKISHKKTVYVPFSEEENFRKHYFSSTDKIYSDRLPKFVVKANIATNGEIIKRLTRIFPNILIDEVQDLAGYDLEIIKLLFKTTSKILLVGDPRQVTYLTHHENKFAKYKEGKIKEFVENECKRPIKYLIDEETLCDSHRNNAPICNFSSLLYKQSNFKPVAPCSCDNCRRDHVEHEGIYLVRPSDVKKYLSRYSPVQLRWDSRKEVDNNYRYYNFGESKGKTLERVLIYPTTEMRNWIFDNRTNLQHATRAKLYVAITRAKYSVGIVADFTNNCNLEGINLFGSENAVI